MFVYVRNLTEHSIHSDTCSMPVSTVERKDPVSPVRPCASIKCSVFVSDSSSDDSWGLRIANNNWNKGLNKWSRHLSELESIFTKFIEIHREKACIIFFLELKAVKIEVFVLDACFAQLQELLLYWSWMPATFFKSDYCPAGISYAFAWVFLLVGVLICETC